MADGGTAPGWGENQAVTGGGDVNGIIMQLAKLFAQLVPAMMGAPGPQSQLARWTFPGAVASMVGGPVAARIQGKEMMGLGVMSAMQDVVGGGGPMAGGFGMGIGASQGMMGGGGMGGMVGTGPQQMSPGEFGGMMGAAGQGGFFRGMADIRATREQMKNLTRTVTELHHELSMTVDNVMNDLATMRQSGGFTQVTQGAQAFRSTLNTAALSGMHVDQALQQYIAPAAQQLRVAARIPMTSAFEAARQGLQTVAGAARAGYISEETLFNTTGMGGEQGAMAFTGQIQTLAMRQMNQARTQYMMAATLDPRTGQVSQERIQQLMSGQMSMSDIERLANQNIQQVGGQAAWQGMMPQIRGQFMAGTGGMGGLAFAQTAMRSMGMSMDSNDPKALAYFQRLTGASDPMQAQGMMQAMNSWGDMQERGKVVEQTTMRQAERAAEITRRVQAADLSKMAGTFVDPYISRVTEGLETGITNIADMAADLLAGGQVQAVTGGGIGAYTQGDTSAFYARVGRRSAAGGVMRSAEDVSREIGAGVSTIADYRSRMKDMDSQSVAYKQMEAAATTYEDAFRSGIGMMMTETSEYWGGRQSDMQLTQEQALAQMKTQGLGEQGAGRYVATETGRSMLMTQFGRAAAGAGGMEGARGIISGVMGKEFGGGTAVEALRGATVAQINEVMTKLVESGGGTAGGEGWREMTEEVAQAVEAANVYGGGGKVSLGVMDIATARRGAVTQAEQLGAAAKQAGLVALGGTATSGPSGKEIEGIMATLQSQPELLAGMSTWISQQGNDWTGTVGQALAGAGVTGEKQKEIFGDKVLDMTFTSRDNAVNFLEGTAQARLTASRDEILMAGALGQDAAKLYEKHRADSGETGRVANALYSAHTQVEAGNVGAGLSAAGSEFQRISRLGGRKYREALSVLEAGTAQKVGQLRGYRSGSSAGYGRGTGSEITIGEARDFGRMGEADIQSALGADLYGIATGGGDVSREYQKEITAKLERAMAQGIAPPAPGKQGVATAEGGAVPGTAPTVEALKQALGEVPQVNVFIKGAGDGVFPKPADVSTETVPAS